MYARPTHIFEIKGALVHVKRGDVSSLVRSFTLSVETYTTRYKYTFFREKSLTFPVGLLKRAIKILRSEFGDGLYLKIKRKDPKVVFEPITADVLAGCTMRDYQVDGTNIALQEQIGILKEATASGKSLVIAAIVYAVAPHGLRILNLVPNRNLLRQTHKKLKELLPNYEIGMIGDGQRDIKQITIATEQTMLQAVGNKAKSELKEYLQSIDCLIIDEVHHNAAGKWYRIALSCPAFIRIGLTASLDDTEISLWRLESICGKVIYKVTPKALQETGHIARPKIYAITDDRVFGGKSIRGQHSNAAVCYQMIAKAGYAENLTLRSCALQLCDVISRYDLPTLILVGSDVQFAKDIGEGLEGMYLSHHVLHGNTPTGIREQARMEMESGKINFIVATTIFDEGADIPSVKHLILLTGGKSDIKVPQRIGRSLRPDKGSNVVYIHDFMCALNPTLAKHALKRIDIYESDDNSFEVLSVEDFGQHLKNIHKICKRELRYGTN